jgi:hypothetical protein
LRSGIQFELKGASMSDHDIKHCRLAVYWVLPHFVW